MKLGNHHEDDEKRHVQGPNGTAVQGGNNLSEIGFPISRRKNTMDKVKRRKGMGISLLTYNKLAYRISTVIALTQDPPWSPGCCFVREPDAQSDRVKQMNSWQVYRKPTR